MGQIVWLMILILISNISFAQDFPSLEELKQSALKNNIEIICKRHEITEYKMTNSIVNNVKGVSSYNFESGDTFYGVMVSFPLLSWFSYRQGLQLKESELERIIQEVITKLEELYDKYCNLYEKVQIINKEVKYKKASLDNISTSKDVIESEKVYRESQLALDKAQRKLENIKYNIEIATSTVKERERKFIKFEKLFEYKRVEEDEIIKVREELKEKIKLLFDLQMQEINLIDEIELLKRDVENKKRFYEATKAEIMNRMDQDYNLVVYEYNRIGREVKGVADNIYRISGYFVK